jgi:hypothetical protein
VVYTAVEMVCISSCLARTPFLPHGEEASWCSKKKDSPARVCPSFFAESRGQAEKESKKQFTKALIFFLAGL